MMTLFRYTMEKGMKKLADIHEPYRSMLREEYQKRTAAGEFTAERYFEITGEEYPQAPEVAAVEETAVEEA